MSESKGFVLLSGGIDSSTVLAKANEDHDEVEAVSIKYGQRHERELRYARQVAAHFNSKHRIVDISKVIGSGGLSDPDSEIPDIDYSEIEGVSPTYVPFRNGLMLAVLTSIAHANGGTHVYYGAHADDAANWAYPDCTPAFAEAMREAIQIGCYDEVELIAPIIYYTKTEVIRLGDRLGVPWELTWSCYKGGEIHCGVCPTCRARRTAFIDAEVNDPTQYMEGI